VKNKNRNSIFSGVDIDVVVATADSQIRETVIVLITAVFNLSEISV